MSNGITSKALAPLPLRSAEEITAFEKQLANADDPDEAEGLFKQYFQIDAEHLEFLRNLGGLTKLREFYYEVLKFDLLHGTNTSSFISEAFYQQLAQDHPDALANPQSARHGVKHRSSLTRSIVDAFMAAERILRDHGIDPAKAALYDIGCGQGKAIAIGMSSKFPFHFRKAVGVDYYREVVTAAQRNLQAEGLAIRPAATQEHEVRFEFADAADFTSFNGVNVVYMYNPFGREIMEGVERNLRRLGGTSVVAYNKPLHRARFEEQGWNTEQELSNRDPDKHTIIFSRGLD